VKQGEAGEMRVKRGSIVEALRKQGEVRRKRRRDKIRENGKMGKGENEIMKERFYFISEIIFIFLHLFFIFSSSFLHLFFIFSSSFLHLFFNFSSSFLHLFFILS
jgi:hypothetical protein